MSKPEYSFLEQYVLTVLEESGFGQLSEANRRVYLPQLVAEAEYYLGLYLMPKLSTEGADKFAALANSGETSPEKWQKFWQEAIPNFDAEVKNVLIKFADRVRNILAKSGA